MKAKDTWQAAAAHIASCTEEKMADLLSCRDPDLARLFEGMQYSVQAGGKRIRPFLVCAFSQLFGGEEKIAISFAAAIEMIHTYSLIHDDLPCMDNDDYRRGRLTNHKVYGEAGAILAGDALLTLAFETLASAPATPEICCAAVRCLASAAGAAGMVGGQIMDIHAEEAPPDLPTLRRLHDRKTGALISAAVELGCLSAGVVDPQVLAACRTYASGIGRAFQIVDDVLDVYGDAKLLGKATGQDAKDGKITYLSYLDQNGAMQEARELTEAAKAAICSYPGSCMLCEFADALLMRKK